LTEDWELREDDPLFRHGRHVKINLPEELKDEEWDA
jgi:hypothetical protein